MLPKCVPASIKCHSIILFLKCVLHLQQTESPQFPFTICEPPPPTAHPPPPAPPPILSANPGAMMMIWDFACSSSSSSNIRDAAELKDALVAPTWPNGDVGHVHMRKSGADLLKTQNTSFKIKKVLIVGKYLRVFNPLQTLKRRHGADCPFWGRSSYISHNPPRCYHGAVKSATFPRQTSLAAGCC